MDIDEFGLLAGDRLEPSDEIPDVGVGFDTLAPTDFPIVATFWRASAETVTRHRNPLMEVAGMSLRTIMVDMLHTVHLGVLHRFIWFTAWAMFDQDSFQVGATRSDARVTMSIQRFRGMLFKWYRMPAQRARKITEVQELTEGMFGGQKRKQILPLKAKESEYLTECMVEYIIPRVSARLQNANAIRDCGLAILNYMKLVRESPPQPHPSVLQRMLNLALRHLRLCALVGVPYGPKRHLFVHMVLRSKMAGCPNTYHTFMDESLNRTLAGVCRGAYASVWERRVLANWIALPRACRGS